MSKPSLSAALALTMLATLCASAQQTTPPTQPTRRAHPPQATKQAATPAPAPNPTEETPPPSPAREQRPMERPEAERGEAGAERNQNVHFDMREVPPIVTHHSTTIGGKRINYTATAGRLPIKDISGNIEAEMFFTAYTLDGENAATRPVTFGFNGGPGSASYWVHLGILGPKRVAMNPDGSLPPAPYHLVDNESSPLDKTDVVIVDAIGTGYSRPKDNATGKKFWGVRGDVEAFGEFIRMYISRYERWGSPLYLFGESYGTFRSAGIAGYLSDKGINFNGIMMLSSLLSYETLEPALMNDLAYPLLLPSLTAVAHYHKKLPADLQSAPEAQARKESEEFAQGEYWDALNKGDLLTPQERQNIIAKLARFTGLTPLIIDQSNLRIDVQIFTHNLLGAEKLRVGRLDGRYTGPDPAGYMNPRGFFDPSSAETGAPWYSTFNNYIRTDLGYKTDMPYYGSGRENPAFTWDNTTSVTSQGRGLVGYPSTAEAMRAAIVKDRHLKVLVLEGYYDLATPYFNANYSFNHMQLPPEYLKNISFATYESGHMVYLEENARHKLKQDFAHFIDETTH
ncbi:MAG: peptidase S10 [Acidobacteriaceae bacterium]